MKTTRIQIVLLSIVFLSGLALVTGCDPPYGYRLVSTGENNFSIRSEQKTSGVPQANAQPADEMVEGRIASITMVDKQFYVTADNGDEHTLKVNDDTKYTLDGKDASFTDLKVNHKVKVGVERDAAKILAKSVEAMSK